MDHIEQINTLLHNESLTESDEIEICKLVKKDYSVLKTTDITKLSDKSLSDLAVHIFSYSYNNASHICYTILKNSLFKCDAQVIFKKLETKNNEVCLLGQFMCNNYICLYVAKQICECKYNFEQIKKIFDACIDKNKFVFFIVVFKYPDINSCNVSYSNFDSIYLNNNLGRLILNLKKLLNILSKKYYKTYR
jgi:hypothetical protein